MNSIQNLRKHPLLFTLLILFIATTLYFWHAYQKEKTDKKFQVAVYKYFLARLEPSNDFIGDNIDDYLPVYMFTPRDAFSETEKSEIFDKALYPLVIWEREIGKKVVGINVRRSSENLGKYTIDYMENDGSSGAFFYGEASPLEWWVPTCEGNCNFSSEYERKFPEVVSQYGRVKQP